MPSLRDIKRRIKSVKNTQQITKAMKMVSAAKLKRAQDEIISARPYAEKMLGLISSLAAKTPPESHPLLAPGAGKEKTALIFITSDRGLCGSFNAVLFRTVERFLREAEGEVSLYLVGKRGIEYFKRRTIEVSKSRPCGSARPGYGNAVEAAADAINAYLSGEVSEVRIIYSEFKSALSQRPVIQKLLPITPERPTEGAEEAGVEMLFEPSKEEALSSLLPKYVEVQIFKALLESSASEHGARMTAMDSASKNASEMIGGLTLKYNRLRQAAITKELMEIIGGAEALK